MAGEWRECNWGDIATLEYGRALRGYENASGRFRVYGTNGPIGWHEEALCPHPGVVVGRKGAYRGIHYSPEPFFVIDTAFYLEPKEALDLRWAYYVLLTYDIDGMDSGSAIPSTSREAFYGLRVRVPPAEEQRAIAQILGTLDDKIDLNRRTNETLEGIARALYRSWFVDFDPVRAKAEGGDPGLPEYMADLFPDSLEESELGEIPTGWRVVTVADVAEINAQTLGRADRLDVIDYIEINEVMRGEVASIVRYERGAEPSRARRRLRHGDAVLSSVRPDRGAHFLCLNPPETLIASTGFVVLSARDDNWAFLYSAVTRGEVGEELGRLADGGAYPAVRPDVIGGLNLVVPTEQGLLLAFQEFVGPLYELSAQNRIESKTLGMIRETLLPKLVSGEIRIKNPERIIGSESP